MLKLALRNIKSKPYRALATALAIAVSVAMIFCMFSFKGAVYDYIYATETADAGNSDIIIATNSSSDRITGVTRPLESLEGIDNICATLKLYAMLNDEYVQLRGFEAGHLEDLQNINVLEGSTAEIDSGVNSDNIIISKAAAEHFGLSVGDRVPLALGNYSTNFYVGAIAANDGYFLSDSPYKFIGLIRRISTLIVPGESLICNEIYITATNGANIDALIESISALPDYAGMKVQVSKDAGYITEQTDSLTAPVVLAGAAVMMLAVACIVLLFMMSEREKISLISKLTVAGATRKQLFAMFFAESVILSFTGAAIGAGLACGIFAALIKLTLSASVGMGISAAYLCGAAVLGAVVAVCSSLIPLARAMKGTVRENQLDVAKKPLFAKLLPIILLVATVISVIIEFTVTGAKGIASIASLLLALCTLGMCAAPLLRGAAKLGAKSPVPPIRISSYNICREKRYARSMTMLTVGMTVSMLLFMAWSLTTSIFNAYVTDFSEMIFITNVQADVNVSEFEQVDGVSAATKMVWRTGELSGNNFDKTMNILGSADLLDIVNFEFITSKDVIKQRIASQEPYVFLDIALSELYGVREGDTLTLTLDDKSADMIVGGIMEHRLFSGNYIVMSSDLIAREYGIGIDTVLAVSDGDTADAVENLRMAYAGRNYYVVEAVEAYRWEVESMDSVFDLIGTLAVVVALFIFLVTVAADIVGRSTAAKERNTLLTAGMSKKALLGAELYEHALSAIVAFVLSFIISVLATACLINALRLFGLYFGFMYEAWVVAVVGLVMAVGYALVPVALNFKKGYNMKKQ